MKKLLLLLLLGALAGGGVWAFFRFVYVEPPEKVYLRAVAAASLGDEEGFLAAFTAPSRPVVAGLLGLARGRDPRADRAHPYYFLVTERIEGSESEKVGETEVTWLTLRRRGDQARATAYDLRMVREPGKPWLIDALAFTGKRRAVDRAR